MCIQWRQNTVYVSTVRQAGVVNYFKLVHCLKTGQMNQKNHS